MVVACRTQQIINSSKNINFSTKLHVPKRRNTFVVRNLLQNNLLQQRENGIFRLCDCRYFHSSREPRSSVAKLSPQELASSNAFYEPTCKSAGWSCQDCYTMKYCLNFIVTVSNWEQVSCSEKVSGGKKPFCDLSTNSCTDVPKGDCDPLLSFQCVRDGLFPDIHNCSRYVNCKNGTVDEVLECSKNYIYSQTYQKCILKLDEDDCKTVICSKDQLAPYPGDSSLYIQCQNNAAVLQMCEERTEHYDLTTNACQNTCTMIGSIPNPQNCKSYFSCSKTNESLLLEENFCQRGGFNPSNGKCQKSYEKACNELVLIDDLYARLVPPFIKNFLTPIKNLLRSFNINPTSLLLKFGFKQQSIITTVRIINYVVTKKRIPPVFISEIVNKILSILPSQIRSIVEYFLSNFFGLKSRSILESSLESSLGKFLIGMKIDVERLTRQLETVSVVKILKEQIKNFETNHDLYSELKLTEEHILSILNELNGIAGIKLLVYSDGLIRFNLYELKLLLKLNIIRLLDLVCKNHSMACKVFDDLWSEYHEKNLDRALVAISVPFQQRNNNEFMRNEKPIHSMLNALMKNFSDFSIILLKLFDDILQELIEKLQEFASNPFVNFVMETFGDVSIYELLNKLIRFKMDVNIFILNKYINVN